MLEVVFSPPTRRARAGCSLYGDLAAAGLVATEKVELVLPRATQVRRVRVPVATLLAVAGRAGLCTRQARSAWLGEESGVAQTSSEAWRAAAALAGLGLIGRGRLVPDLSSGWVRAPGGWRRSIRRTMGG